MICFSGFTVFPAYAGMSLRVSVVGMASMSFPRLRGDEPALTGLTGTDGRFSPPTRG